MNGEMSSETQEVEFPCTSLPVMSSMTENLHQIMQNMNNNVSVYLLG